MPQLELQVIISSLRHWKSTFRHLNPSFLLKNHSSHKEIALFPKNSLHPVRHSLHLRKLRSTPSDIRSISRNSAPPRPTFAPSQKNPLHPVQHSLHLRKLRSTPSDIRSISMTYNSLCKLIKTKEGRASLSYLTNQKKGMTYHVK